MNPTSRPNHPRASRTVFRGSALAIALAAWLGIGSTRADTLTWALAGGGDWDTTTANWTGDATTFTSDGTQDVVFNNTAGGTINVPETVTVLPMNIAVSATSGTYRWAGGQGNIGGTGTLTKSGAGTLKIGQPDTSPTIPMLNTFSGGTIINGGELWLEPTSHTGLGTGPVTLNDGTLRLYRINAANDLIVNGGKIHTQNGFGNNWNGTVTLNATLPIEPVHKFSINGVISGPGGLTIQTQTNTVVLTAPNTYTGATSVTKGTLQCDTPDSLGGGDLSISSGGAKVNLNYSGTKSIGSLTLGGVAQTSPGTYGSPASDATFKSEYFNGTGTVSSGDPAKAAYITSFGTNVSGSSAIIDPVAANAADIAWIVPSGTNLATLAPDFALTAGATCSERNSGEPPTPGFDAGPVVYTVVSPDASVTNIYTVTVTVLPAESTLIWNLGSGGDWDLATSNWVGQTSGLPTPFFDGVDVIFDKTAGGTIAIDAGMSPLSTTVSATSGTYTFEGGPIATGTLIKDGGGQLTINADNTFNGGTTINNGTLRLNFPASAAPLGTGPVTLNNGQLFLWRVNATNSLTINGGSIFSGNGFGNNWNGPITLNADFICNTQYKMACNDAVSGSGGFVKSGNAQLTLTGSNTFAGTLVVQAGTLEATSLNSISGGTATSNLGAPTTVANGTISLGATTSAGTLLYSGPGETTDRVIELAGTTGGATLVQAGTNSGIPTTRGESGLLKFTAGVSIPGTAGTDNRKTLTLTHAASATPGSGEISGSIGDSLAGNGGQLATSVTKAGAGTWTLSGANTYSGTTQVQAGTLALRRADALGGGTLDISTGARVRLDFIGTRQVSALTFDAGPAQPDGSYGSSDSLATYQDDTRFAGPGTVTIGTISAPSTTTLARSAGTDPSIGGTAVTFTATVAGTAPTGSVRFYDGLTLIGTSALDDSYQASLTIATLGGGTHAITALYVGDAGNTSSASAALAHTVVDSRPASSTSLALTGGSNPSSQGAAVTFTATVTGTAPTGRVTFHDGTTPLGAATLNGSAQTSLTTSGLAVGWHAITAHYEGDANHMASVSTPLFLAVDPLGGNGKLKVFILAGQSNMEGFGSPELGRDPNNLTGPQIQSGLGSLRNAVAREPLVFGYLEDPDNPVAGKPGWITRDDVWVSYWDAPLGTNVEKRSGFLDSGFGVSTDRFGPEYGFGLTVGNALPDEVLIIKTAWGGKSLAVDFRPPSSSGATGPYYTEMVTKVDEVLDNLASYYPGYDGNGHEIVGFGWHQGWNDRVNASYVAEYEANLANLIRDLRTEFGVADMPVVIANSGLANAPTGPGSLIEAQGAVSDPAQYPEFAGTVTTVDTIPFDYGELLSPGNQSYHWYWNAESYLNMGNRMGEAMIALQPGTTASAFATWASDPAQGLTAGVNDGPLDDPDFDGLDNLMEFALGGDPLVPSTANLPTLSPDGGGAWLFEYDRSNASAPPATTQIVEYGSDLENWTEVEIPLTSAGIVTITPGTPTDRVRVAIPEFDPTGFARLKVNE